MYFMLNGKNGVCSCLEWAGEWFLKKVLNNINRYGLYISYIYGEEV